MYCLYMLFMFGFTFFPMLCICTVYICCLCLVLHSSLGCVYVLFIYVVYVWFMHLSDSCVCLIYLKKLP